MKSVRSPCAVLRHLCSFSRIFILLLQALRRLQSIEFLCRRDWPLPCSSLRIAACCIAVCAGCAFTGQDESIVGRDPKSICWFQRVKQHGRVTSGPLGLVKTARRWKMRSQQIGPRPPTR